MTRKKIYKKLKTKKYKKSKIYKKTYKRYKIAKRRQRGGELKGFCKDNTAVCMSLSHHSNEIKGIFKGFKFFDQVGNNYESLSRGNQGFTHKITYTDNELEVQTVLKSKEGVENYEAFNNVNDNLFYEYLVGTFINKCNKRFPCFVETFGLYRYKEDITAKCKGCGTELKGDEKCPEDWCSYYNEHVVWGEKAIRRQIPHEALGQKPNLTDIIQHLDQPLKLSDIYISLSKYGCHKYNILALLINYIPESIPFSTMLSDEDFLENELLYVLFQIYIPLSLLGDKFTHYDLNAKNIMLHKLDKYIDYEYHLEGGIIKFKSRYIAKIIDYGRCYFHADEKINTQNILTLIHFNRKCLNIKFDREDDDTEPDADPDNDNDDDNDNLLIQKAIFRFNNDILEAKEQIEDQKRTLDKGSQGKRTQGKRTQGKRTIGKTSGRKTTDRKTIETQLAQEKITLEYIKKREEKLEETTIDNVKLFVKNDIYKNDHIFNLHEKVNRTADLSLLVFILKGYKSTHKTGCMKNLLNKIEWSGKTKTDEIEIISKETGLYTPKEIIGESPDRIIRNIHDAANFFINEVHAAAAAAANEKHFAGKPRLGTLNIYSNGQDMVFTPHTE